MDCPKCQVEMKVYPAKDGVEMDYCYSGCKGIWFDRYELAFHTDTEKDIPGFNKLLQSAQQTSYECGKCKEALLEIEYVEQAGLKIDVCQKCHGVFLDARELGTLKALASKKTDGYARIKRVAERLEAQGYSTTNKKS